MHILVEEFLNDNVAFKKDCYDTLINDREKFIDWRPNWGLIKFILEQLFPFTSSSFKSIAATAHEIADHYDRGNDFFNAFLGPKMIYTSAFYHNLDETLEKAQVHVQQAAPLLTDTAQHHSTSPPQPPPLTHNPSFLNRRTSSTCSARRSA